MCPPCSVPISIVVKVCLSFPISSILSLSNLNFVVDTESADSTVKTVHWESSQGLGKDVDFDILISCKDPHKPSSVVECSPDGHSTAACVTFLPSWDHLDPDTLDPTSEIIFLVDRHTPLNFL
eukprot:TRINITY_DN1305_c0_g1_i13.p1 TRINITY_DN1305_c0_g1~~TRINITY_DN1305_c0_g1_i13.p1  ORF type:complete len:123 (+),score=13.75 TRINITY_DN1305_c0_g1_i13:159-527(+)